MRPILLIQAVGTILIGRWLNMVSMAAWLTKIGSFRSLNVCDVSLVLKEASKKQEISAACLHNIVLNQIGALQMMEKQRTLREPMHSPWILPSFSLHLHQTYKAVFPAFMKLPILSPFSQTLTFHSTLADRSHRPRTRLASIELVCHLTIQKVDHP